MKNTIRDRRSKSRLLFVETQQRPDRNPAVFRPGDEPPPPLLYLRCAHLLTVIFVHLRVVGSLFRSTRAGDLPCKFKALARCLVVFERPKRLERLCRVQSDPARAVRSSLSGKRGGICAPSVPPSDCAYTPVVAQRNGAVPRVLRAHNHAVLSVGRRIVLYAHKCKSPVAMNRVKRARTARLYRPMMWSAETVSAKSPARAARMAITVHVVFIISHGLLAS